MRILVLGATGMLGHTIYKFLNQTNNNIDCYGTIRNKKDKEFFSKHLSQNLRIFDDFNNFNKLDKFIKKINPKIILNCIGLIKQRENSENQSEAIFINSLLPHQISKVCKELEIRFIHFSTDCVFSGSKGNYKESDLPDARDIYGLTKLMGEINDKNNLTIRTSIIGHELKDSLGLLEWFLGEKNDIRGYSRAIFSGLTTLEVSRFLLGHIFKNNKIYGVYHLASEPITKLKLLEIINKVYKSKKNITSSDSLKINRSLDASKLIEVTKYKVPNWESMIMDLYKWKNNYEKIL